MRLGCRGTERSRSRWRLRRPSRRRPKKALADHDLKPANQIRTRRQVKVLDFDLTKIVDVLDPRLWLR